MSDIEDPRLLYLKAVLFLAAGTTSGALILHQHPEIELALLLVIAIWGFARAYYFAFYVVEKYVEPGYRFSGLGSFVAYLWARRRR